MIEPEYVQMIFGDPVRKYEELRGRWVVANLQQNIGWTEDKVIVIFRNQKMLLLPDENKLLPAVAVRCGPNLNHAEAQKVLMHFLSSLAWVDHGQLEILHWGGGDKPYRSSGPKFFTKFVTKDFPIDYLPDTEDRDTRLALAFFREGLSLSHSAYSFLSYYKIINLKFNNGSKQIKWIRNNLIFITDHNVKLRINELVNQGIDVADYIYRSCRCAIAHAGTSPTVDPENIDDHERLMKDLPIIKNLAELIIENEFNIPTIFKVRNLHLYELSGFKKYIGQQNIDYYLSYINFPEPINLPSLVSVRIWKKTLYKPFETMKISKWYNRDNYMILQCVSESKYFVVDLFLDFKNERLHIDPLHGIIIQDDGTVESALEISDYYRFLADYFGNGRLEIWDKVESKCLGRCDPFIPTNIDLGITITNFLNQSELLLKEAEKRKSI